jgi:hypothetical protein
MTFIQLPIDDATRLARQKLAVSKQSLEVRRKIHLNQLSLARLLPERVRVALRKRRAQHFCTAEPVAINFVKQ